MPDAPDKKAGIKKKTQPAIIAGCVTQILFAFNFDYFFPTVKTARANVMTQMIFAGGRLNRCRRVSQEIMRAMHATLGWGFFILLDCHVNAPRI
jgi:hypothetical protein